MSRSPGTPNQQLAAVVRGVIIGRASLDPWLEFPQSTCCFVFGPQKLEPEYEQRERALEKLDESLSKKTGLRSERLGYWQSTVSTGGNPV